MPPVQPALEQLFEVTGERMDTVPPPVEINETEQVVKQVMDVLDKSKQPKRISEMV